MHQDINKIVATTEYSADASLTRAKFVSQSLASTITSRRLIWLRGWKADVKAKWKLASAPYQTRNLFGAALEPVLVEDKDKRKVLPSSYRRPEHRYMPCSQRQHFRPTSASGGSVSQRPSFHGGDRFADQQQFGDRGRSHYSTKRHSRGSGYKPFRRGK